MKTLVLIRHAKSSWKNAHILTDKERPLNGRGKIDSVEMGNRLLSKNLIPDLIITSGAKRTEQTAKNLETSLNRKIEIIEQQALFHCSSEDIQHVINHIDKKYNVVFLLGHNPSINDFASNYIKGFMENVPTCGVLCFDLDMNDWKLFQPDRTRLRFFDYPKNK